jgi:glycosyltransferase 2 family protein
MKLGSNRSRLIIGCLIGLVFLYLAGRKVDFSLMWEAFTKVNYWLVLLAIPVIFLSHFLRALRWRFLMSPIKRVDMASLFSALLIGYMANILMPAHLGELLRAYVLGKKRGVSASSTFATIVVERIIDVFALLLLMVFAILLYPFPEWINKAGYAMLVGTVGLLLFLILLKKHFAFFERYINLFFKPLTKGFQERLGRGIRSFVVGIVPLQSGWDYLVVAVLSVVIWGCYGFIIHLVLYAFDFVSVYHLPWSTSLIVLVVTTIGIVVPSSPGYVGTYHWLCQISLAMFGVPAGPALSFAILTHGVNFLPVLIAGLILAYYEGLEIFRLQDKSSSAKGGPE